MQIRLMARFFVIEPELPGRLPQLLPVQHPQTFQSRNDKEVIRLSGSDTQRTGA